MNKMAHALACAQKAHDATNPKSWDWMVAAHACVDAAQELFKTEEKPSGPPPVAPPGWVGPAKPGELRARSVARCSRENASARSRSPKRTQCSPPPGVHQVDLSESGGKGRLGHRSSSSSSSRSSESVRTVKYEGKPTCKKPQVHDRNDAMPSQPQKKDQAQPEIQRTDSVQKGTVDAPRGTVAMSLARAARAKSMATAPWRVPSAPSLDEESNWNPLDHELRPKRGPRPEKRHCRLFRRRNN